MFRALIVLSVFCQLKASSASTKIFKEPDNDFKESEIPVYKPYEWLIDGSDVYSKSHCVRNFRYALLEPGKFAVVYFGEKGAGKSRLIEIATYQTIGTISSPRFTSNGEGHTKATSNYSMVSSSGLVTVDHHDTVGFCDSTKEGRLNIVRAALEFRTKLYANGCPLRRVYFIVNAQCGSSEHIENNLRFMGLAYGNQAVARVTFIVNQCDSRTASPKSFFDGIATQLQDKVKNVVGDSSMCKVLFTSCQDGKPFQLYEDLILASRDVVDIKLGDADNISRYERLPGLIHACKVEIEAKELWPALVLQSISSSSKTQERLQGKLESGKAVLTNMSKQIQMKRERIDRLKEKHKDLSSQFCLKGTYSSNPEIWRILSIDTEDRCLEALIYEMVSARQAGEDAKQIKYDNSDAVIKLFMQYESCIGGTFYHRYLCLDVISEMTKILEKRLDSETAKKKLNILEIEDTLAKRKELFDKLDAYMRAFRLNSSTLRGVSVTLNNLKRLASLAMGTAQRVFQFVKGEHQTLKTSSKTITNQENELKNDKTTFTALKDSLESDEEDFVLTVTSNLVIETVSSELNRELQELEKNYQVLTGQHAKFEKMLGYFSSGDTSETFANEIGERLPPPSTYETGETSGSK